MGNRSIFLGLISILCVNHIESGIVRIDTISTESGKKITFLSDNHSLNEGEQDKVDGIVGWLQENEKTNCPTHVLVEQPLWICDIFGSESDILFHLPNQIQEEALNLTLTKYENLEIRHVANLAYMLLTMPVPYQCKFYKDCKIDGIEKTLGTLTFQDILNEFVRIKRLFSDYYLQQDNPIMTRIYNQSIIDADDYYRHIIRIIKEDGIHPDNFIFKYTKKTSLIKKASLANAVRDAFSPFFDLHAIRVLLNSSHKNIMVVAGFWHTHNIMSALDIFNTYYIYSAGADIYRDQQLVSISQIQKGLSVQKQSLMRVYAPMVIRMTMISVACYLLYMTAIKAII